MEALSNKKCVPISGLVKGQMCFLFQLSLLVKKYKEKKITWENNIHRCSGYIRHILMHNHVIGKVPKLQFSPDRATTLDAELEKFFLDFNQHDETNLDGKSFFRL